MQLTLDKISELGGYVGAPVKREVKWLSEAGEQIAHVYVKLESYETAMAELEGRKQDIPYWINKFLVHLVDDAGNHVFTDPKQITGDPETGKGKLRSSLFFALVNAINIANGLMEEEQKKPLTPNSSGTNLCLPESEEELSPKPNETLATLKPEPGPLTSETTAPSVSLPELSV